jgi:predicted O-methyltransferase YrrM
MGLHRGSTDSRSPPFVTTPQKARALAKRILGRQPIHVRPPSPLNTYVEPGNQWYRPTLGGALTLAPRLGGSQMVREALMVLERLSEDVYLTFVRNFYAAGLSAYGDGWQYADINTALLGLAATLHPAHYLEIGVRRGRSLAMVASRVPSCHIVACDLFIANYANMDNPGPQLVRSELQRLGFSGTLDFVVGDSSKVLPAFFREHPDLYFDVITVDGDHTAKGAYADLVNVIPRLKAGGALVFDDISNHSHPELLPVWEQLIVADTRFSTYTFTDIGFGVGVAILKG